MDGLLLIAAQCWIVHETLKHYILSTFLVFGHWADYAVHIV